MRWWILAALLSLSVTESRGVIDSLETLPDIRPRDADIGLDIVPHAITVDPLRRLWILDRARGRVLVVTETDGAGRSISVSDPRNSEGFPFADIAASGSYLFLLDPSSPGITLLDLDGYARERVDLAAELEAVGQSAFSASRLLVGRSGDLWLIDFRGSVLHFDRRGRFLDAPLDALAGKDRPKRIADACLAPDDAVILLNPEEPSLLTLVAAGGIRPSRAVTGKLSEPASIAVDREGWIYIMEGNGRVRVVDQDGRLQLDRDPRPEEGDGRGRACIAGGDSLMRADPAEGVLHRWRIVRAAPRDENR